MPTRAHAWAASGVPEEPASINARARECARGLKAKSVLLLQLRIRARACAPRYPFSELSLVGACRTCALGGDASLGVVVQRRATRTRDRTCGPAGSLCRSSFASL